MGVDEVHHSDSTPSRRHVRALAGNNQQGASVGCASGPDLDGLAPVRDQVRERLPHRQSLQDSAAGDRPLQPLPQFWRNGDRVLVRHGGIVARGRSVEGCTARVGELLDGLRESRPLRLGRHRRGRRRGETIRRRRPSEAARHVNGRAVYRSLGQEPVARGGGHRAVDRAVPVVGVVGVFLGPGAEPASDPDSGAPGRSVRATG